MTEEQYYRGVFISPHPDVHERAMGLILAHVPIGAAILDVGAGHGAFVMRLLDHGYRDVEALELAPEHFQVEGITCHQLDLNDDSGLRPGRRYGCVVAIEVIEHLENPFHFVRECTRLLKPQGLLLLTTPNITSIKSRVDFLIKGQFRNFHDADYEGPGHIQPVSLWQLEKIALRNNLRFLAKAHSSNRSLFRPDGTIQDLLKVILAAALFPFVKGFKAGECGIFLLQKCTESMGREDEG